MAEQKERKKILGPWWCKMSCYTSSRLQTSGLLDMRKKWTPMSLNHSKQDFLLLITKRIHNWIRDLPNIFSRSVWESSFLKDWYASRTQVWTTGCIFTNTQGKRKFVWKWSQHTGKQNREESDSWLGMSLDYLNPAKTESALDQQLHMKSAMNQ